MTIICRPGEHLVAGRVAVHNADVLGNHVACNAVRYAPQDMIGLTDEELRALRYRQGRVRDLWSRDPMWSWELADMARALGARLEVERLRRGWLV